MREKYTVISWCARWRPKPSNWTCLNQDGTIDQNGTFPCEPPFWGLGLIPESIGTPGDTVIGVLNLDISGTWASFDSTPPTKPPLFPPALQLVYGGVPILTLDPKGVQLLNFAATLDGSVDFGPSGQPIYQGHWGAAAHFRLEAIMLATPDNPYPDGHYDLVFAPHACVVPFYGPLDSSATDITLGANDTFTEKDFSDVYYWFVPTVENPTPPLSGLPSGCTPIPLNPFEYEWGGGTDPSTGIYWMAGPQNVCPPWTPFPPDQQPGQYYPGKGYYFLGSVIPNGSGYDVWTPGYYPQVPPWSSGAPPPLSSPTGLPAGLHPAIPPADGQWEPNPSQPPVTEQALGHLPLPAIYVRTKV